MKKLFVAGLAFVSLTAFANPHTFKITRVIDGDTVEFQADFMPDPLPKKLSIRVLGVDTPEKGHRAHAHKKLLRQRRHHSSQKIHSTLQSKLSNQFSLKFKNMTNMVVVYWVMFLSMVKSYLQC
jgi:endonuclease YncB( thermonuclease family)